MVYETLKAPRKKLILCLLGDIADNALRNKLTACLDAAMVYDMNDGGMGSIHFIATNDDKRKMKICIAERIFIDVDKIPIMA